MEINRTAQAGSLESQDILVTIKKGAPKSGIVIDFDSPSKVQYGSRIKKEIESVLEKFNISDVIVEAIDKGALAFTIKARTEAALLRAAEK
jgi:citrate lyase subunit gamma (acyl carrier protein)